MASDGSGQRRLTRTPNPAIGRRPGLVPRWKRVAFGSNRDGSLEIYLMAADGSGRQRL